jgi:hypothetical protein
MPQPITDPASHGKLTIGSNSGNNNSAYYLWKKLTRTIAVFSGRIQANEKDKLASRFKTIAWNPYEDKLYESIYDQQAEYFLEELGEIPLVYVYIPYDSDLIVVDTAVPLEAKELLGQVEAIILSALKKWQEASLR